MPLAPERKPRIPPFLSAQTLNDPDFELTISEDLYEYGLELVRSGHSPPVSIHAQLSWLLEQGYSPAEAVGELVLGFDDLPFWKFGGISNVLSDQEAARLYLFRELSKLKDYKIDERLDDPGFRRELGLHTDVSERTITRIADLLNDDYAGFVKPQLENVAREFEDGPIADAILDPPATATDGMDAPPAVKQTRVVKTTGYSCIKIGRVGPTQYDKWELMKPFELAAKDNIHLNDARNCLAKKPFYWNRKTPGAKAAWNQMRTYTRGQFRVMFLAAFEQYLDVLDRGDLLPAVPDVAIDLTGWPWFGIVDDDDTPIEERRQPVGVEGTKPGRNTAYSWQFATISLVNCEIPMTFAARSVEKRNRRHYHVRHLLNYAKAKFDLGRVYLDKDFYTEKVADELDKQDVEFVMTAPRNMNAFGDLVMGSELREDAWNSMPYEIGTGPKKDADTYLFVNPSEKRLKRADTGLEDRKNWEAYYTNIDPDKIDGGGDFLASQYRLRWAIETAYRKLKKNFLVQSATPLRNQRVFLFNLAILYNDMWMAANVLESQRTGEPVKDKHGRYLITANEFMTALLDDFEPVEIGEVENLSEKSTIVREASEIDTTP